MRPQLSRGSDYGKSPPLRSAADDPRDTALVWLAMYRFLLKPRWLLSHVLVAAMVVGMLAAMMWQVSRLHQKQDLNARIEQRAHGEVLALGDVLAGHDLATDSGQDDVEYQAVSARGTYDTDHEFTIPNRTLDGAPGRLVITPFVWSDTEAPILVNRGFIPQSFTDDTAPIDGVEPPEGEVAIAGYLRLTELPGSLQTKRVDVGDNRFARLDLAAIAEVQGTALQPVYLLLGSQEPPTAQERLTMYPLPPRSEGKHFSYAVQWAIFTLIACIGYPLVLRRIARNRAGQIDDDMPTEGMWHADARRRDDTVEVGGE